MLTIRLIIFAKNLWNTAIIKGLPGGSKGKESTQNEGNAGDKGSIPGSERSPGEGHGNHLQYSCLENLMDRGAGQVMVHSVTNMTHVT